VKATDELCTRTFAVHTLKSPPTKMPKFPDWGGIPYLNELKIIELFSE